LLSKIATMRVRNVLSSRIDTKNTNVRVKLSANHSSNLLVDRHKLTPRGHKIDPSKT